METLRIDDAFHVIQVISPGLPEIGHDPFCIGEFGRFQAAKRREYTIKSDALGPRVVTQKDIDIVGKNHSGTRETICQIEGRSIFSSPVRGNPQRQAPQLR